MRTLEIRHSEYSPVPSQGRNLKQRGQKSGKRKGVDSNGQPAVSVSR